MIQITLDLSNDGADAAVTEIKSFLRFENERMARAVDPQDARGNAALGYVVLRKILSSVESGISAREAKVRAEQIRRQGPPPTVREERSRP